MRLVIFDCDGTLVDSQHNIVAAMTEAFRTHGVAVPEPDSVRRVVGLNLIEAIVRLLPVELQDRASDIGGSYVEAFRVLRTRRDHEEPLYPGVVEVLDALDAPETILGIATGKSRRGLHSTLDRHGLRERFVVLKTADDGPGKPHPRILLDAMAEAGAAAESTAMIGDTVFDMRMARRAEAYAIGVGWGYHEAEELDAAGAHRVIESFGDLPETLETLWRAK
jgi:phosphoglycolate phosphatase